VIGGASVTAVVVGSVLVDGAVLGGGHEPSGLGAIGGASPSWHAGTGGGVVVVCSMVVAEMVGWVVDEPGGSGHGMGGADGFVGSGHGRGVAWVTAAIPMTTNTTTAQPIRLRRSGVTARPPARRDG
jgi:hypothetical protein